MFKGYTTSSFDWQIKGLALLPWTVVHHEHREDLVISHWYVGWMFIQAKWFCIN